MGLPYKSFRWILVATLAIAMPKESWGYVDPPTFSPEQPFAGQPVDLSVRTGLCHGFMEPPPGVPATEVQVNGDVIDVIFPGVVLTSPLCMLNEVTTTRNIGAFSSGVYTVRVRFRSIYQIPEVTPPLSQSVLVVGPAPQLNNVPTGGSAALLLLGFGMLAIAIGRLRRGAATLVVPFGLLLCSSPQIASAREDGDYLQVIIEISRGDGAPDPQEIVDFDFSKGGRPPLEGLAVGGPEWAAFLISKPFRAQGDYKRYLDSHPDLPRASLENSVVVKYRAGADPEEVLSALSRDRFICYAVISEKTEILADGRTGEPGEVPAMPYWVDVMGFEGAWKRAGGWSRVGILDNGLQIDHPDLISLTPSGALTGGNFLADHAIDVSRKTSSSSDDDYNVDEMEPVAAPGSVCDFDGDGYIVPVDAGHGTHVHGLIAANHTNNDGVVGACKRCGMVSVKVLRDYCDDGPIIVRHELNMYAVIEGMTVLIDKGVQVINMSFGWRYSQALCTNSGGMHPLCKAIALANSKGVMMVASSGNNKTSLQFPASDPRVVSVGGTTDQLALWDRYSEDGACPYPDTGIGNDECGSNYTTPSNGPKQELVAPAKDILSTVYTGMDWNFLLRCGDWAFETPYDGFGFCTGTSMSAPIISGLAGILRSVNPLVLPGKRGRYLPNASGAGVRSLLADSSILPIPGTNWDNKLGYGRPLADAAVILMMGKVGGYNLRNRLTPLFSFYSSGAMDWAYTTTPQSALMYIEQAHSYQPQGVLTPGYTGFPYADVDGAPPAPPPAPRANAYVFTAEMQMWTSHPKLIPLYWLGRDSSKVASRDFLLTTSETQVQSAVSLTNKYSYQGIQGYIYQACSPEPQCIPLHAQKLWLKCKVVADDCAVFLENQRISFESQGYTSAFLGGSMLLGYAYPVVDTDGDGLIDAFEFLIGTNPNSVDSDSDGIPDGVELPQANLPVSDPCSNSGCGWSTPPGS